VFVVHQKANRTCKTGRRMVWLLKHSQLESPMELCYLCGITLDSKVDRSDDHIPPRCLFEEGTDQVTVPCCRSCNEEYAILDEHFKTQLTFTTLNVPSNVREKSIRAISPQEGDNEKKYRIRRSKFFKLGVEDVIVQGNRRLKIVFDIDLLNKWLSRIIKGLYYKEVGERMPASLSFTTTPHYEVPIPEAIADMFNDKRSQVFWWSIMPEELQNAFAKESETWMFIFYKTIFITTDVRWKST
jgi:hypothetical protein